MNQTQIHAFLEFTGKWNGRLEKGNNTLKAISGAQAFRRYQWLQRIPNKLAWELRGPARNISGNFRGMVVNAEAKAVFDFTVKAGKWIGAVGTFVTIAEALDHSYDEVDRIVRSGESWDVKSARLSAQLTGMAMSVLTGVVTPTAHFLLTSMSIQGYCDMVDVARGLPLGTCTETLRNVDTVIKVAAEEVSDGDEIYSWINTDINPRVSKFLGL